ncbi:MAG TPA: DUF937 domain-containing protein [Thermoanaerobaculia bacterium]|nr:DUF937 domain-containing protein [Thermoanaerobaculia bacterium]
MALIDMIQQQLDDSTVSQLSQQLGADPNTTRQAVPAALTALLGGLSHNAQQPDGAQQLDSALADHEGAAPGGLATLLGSGSIGSQGGGILGHIFGNHQPAVASQVGQRTGLNQSQAARLLILLAPFVLHYLAKQRQQQPVNAGAGAGYAPAGGGMAGGITDILNGERQRIEQTHPQHSGLFDILGNLAGGLLRGGR